MSTYPKLRPPIATILDPLADVWPFAFAEVTAHCKHGPGECDRCGTSELDTRHTTIGGRGFVARIRKQT
jgi:hypothetical protein